MKPLAISIAPETHADQSAINALHERAFGPGRFARTASRIREQAALDPRLCFVARVGTLLVGSIRLTPISIGNLQHCLLLGPLAVEPAFDGKGIGSALMNRSIDAARALGYQLVILIGDEPYYGRFGFRRVPFEAIDLPGPVDPARLLHLDLAEGALAGLGRHARVKGEAPL
ncbi:MAG: N-acetyltransferase [Beijerinckiaceae bacterium]|nr:N-acetyltransferase [Beijerinckiaceae bacterium]